jgi:hypothetical protein
MMERSLKRIGFAAVTMLLLLFAGGGLFAEGASEVAGMSLFDLGSISGINRITNGTSVDLIIALDERPEIRAEGDEEVIDSLRFQIDGDLLRIRQNRPVSGWFASRSTTLYINLEALEALTLSGTGNAQVSGVIRSDELELLTTGTGDIAAQARVERFTALSTGTGDMTLRVIAEEAEIRLTGAGDMDLALITRDAEIINTGAGGITLEGRGDFIDLRLTGAGSLRGIDFAAAELEAALTGAGSAEMTVVDRVDARLTGVGSLRIRGTADIGELVQTGIGRLEQVP